MSDPITAAEIWGETSDEYSFQRLGENRYTLDLARLSTTFEVDRVRRERSELRAELTVHCAINGARTFRGVLLSGDVNLSSTETRRRLASNLGAQSKTSADEWVAALERLHILVREAERTGDPALPLRTVARPQPDEQFEVEGLKLLKRHPCILFGDGGSLKSYLALFLAGCLERCGVRVGLFDWELSAEDHRDRIERLFGADFPNLIYVRCSRPLAYEVDRLTRFKQEHGLEYAIFDSIAFACNGAPESAEAANEYFRAVRQIGIGSLHIAHVTKNAETGDQRPFGSAFWHNGARATWFVKQAEASPDSRLVTIGLYPRKANLSALQRPMAFQATFAADATRIARVDIADEESLAASLPLWQRVKHAVRTRPRTITELAEELKANADSIEKAVKRGNGAKVLTLQRIGDGPAKVAILERRLA